MNGLLPIEDIKIVFSPFKTCKASAIHKRSIKRRKFFFFFFLESSGRGAWICLLFIAVLGKALYQNESLRSGSP